MRLLALFSILSVLLVAGTAAAEEPMPGAILFGKKCAGCHTIGEGDRAGPDLLNVTKRRDVAWIKAFVRGPQAKITAGDPVAVELFNKFNKLPMPDQPLTDEELDALLAYFEDCAAKGVCKPYLGAVKHAKDAQAAEIAAGKALFEGRTRLAKGGPACMSCHNVKGAGILGGGTLAKDLTGVHARLQDAGLQSALETTPFPLMQDVYKKRPLTAAEAFAIKAYLYDAGLRGSQAPRDHNFLYLGVVGLFASLGTIGAIWSGRMRGVRQSIVKRAARS